MEIKDRISQWVDSHRAELLRDIGRLVAVKSVRGEPAEARPLAPGRAGRWTRPWPSAGSTALRRKCTAAPWARPSSAASPARWTSSDTWTWWARARLGHRPLHRHGKGRRLPLRPRHGRRQGPGGDRPLCHALPEGAGVELSHGCRLIMGTDEESGSGDLPYFYKDNAPAPTPSRPTRASPSTTRRRAAGRRTSAPAGRSRTRCRAWPRSTAASA